MQSQADVLSNWMKLMSVKRAWINILDFFFGWGGKEKNANLGDLRRVDRYFKVIEMNGRDCISRRLKFLGIIVSQYIIQVMTE